MPQWGHRHLSLHLASLDRPSDRAPPVTIAEAGLGSSSSDGQDRLTRESGNFLEMCRLNAQRRLAIVLTSPTAGHILLLESRGMRIHTLFLIGGLLAR